MIPAIIKMASMAQRMPPHAVKSILVWNAKSVRANVTPHVIPTAIRIADAEKWAHNVPNMKPSAMVKTERKMMLVGNFLRTPSQHAIPEINDKSYIPKSTFLQIFSTFILFFPVFPEIKAKMAKFQAKIVKFQAKIAKFQAKTAKFQAKIAKFQAKPAKYYSVLTK